MLSTYQQLGYMPESGTGPDQIAEPGSVTVGLDNSFRAIEYQSSVVYTKNSDISAQFLLTIANANGNINGQTLTFEYVDIDGALTMKCIASAAINQKYLPKHCNYP